VALQNLLDKEVADAGLFLPSGAKNVYLGGLYSTTEQKGLHGVFMTTINPATGTINSKTHAFTPEFLDGITSKREKKKGGLSAQFRIKDFITFADGSLSFIAEESYTMYSFDANGSVSSSRSHSDEIIIPRFSKDGALLNIEKIDKKFNSISPGECSYSFIPYNGETYLIYNDAKKRKEKKSVKGKGMKKGSRYTDLCIIGEDGKIRKQKTLFTDGVTDSFYQPWLSFFADDKIIIGTTKRKKYKFGTLRLSSKK